MRCCRGTERGAIAFASASLYCWGWTGSMWRRSGSSAIGRVLVLHGVLTIRFIAIRMVLGVA